jgi:hypothetical protein
MLKDLADGGVRSIILRYLTPGYLGIQISIAHLLASGITFSAKLQKISKILIFLIFSGSIISCLAISHADFWWTKSHSDVNFHAAQSINKYTRPLIISDGSMGMIMGLSHHLNPQVQLQLKPYCHTCRLTPPTVLQQKLLPIPDGFDVFLFAPSQKLIQEVKQYPTYALNPVGVDLWYVTNHKV